MDGDPSTFGRRADHEVVVVGVVGDVAGAVGLLDAADAVLEAGRAGHRPGPGQGLRVAQYGRKTRRPAVRLGGEVDRQLGQLGTSGQRHGSEPLAR
jgi:hypothetical protein